MSFKAEVTTSPFGDSWSSNIVRFATLAEAKAYAEDLAGRWLAVRDWRVVPSDDPVNYQWVFRQMDLGRPGEAIRLEDLRTAESDLAEDR